VSEWVSSVLCDIVFNSIVMYVCACAYVRVRLCVSVCVCVCVL
jgi:hypothetical protein